MQVINHLVWEVYRLTLIRVKDVLNLVVNVVQDCKSVSSRIYTDEICIIIRDEP